MPKSDATFYRRRALQEQVAAARASCEVARDRHEELAAMYRFRLAMVETKPESWADVFETEREQQSAYAPMPVA